MLSAASSQTTSPAHHDAPTVLPAGQHALDHLVLATLTLRSRGIRYQSGSLLVDTAGRGLATPEHPRASPSTPAAPNKGSGYLEISRPRERLSVSPDCSSPIAWVPFRNPTTERQATTTRPAGPFVSWYCRAPRHHQNPRIPSASGTRRTPPCNAPAANQRGGALCRRQETRWSSSIRSPRAHPSSSQAAQLVARDEKRRVRASERPFTRRVTSESEVSHQRAPCVPLWRFSSSSSHNSSPLQGNFDLSDFRHPSRPQYGRNDGISRLQTRELFPRLIAGSRSSARSALGLHVLLPRCPRSRMRCMCRPPRPATDPPFDPAIAAQLASRPPDRCGRRPVFCSLLHSYRRSLFASSRRRSNSS